MEKPLLTPHGVQEKTNSLYQLSDAELQVQADLISYNLIDWIADNFTATPEQMDFLEGLSEGYVDALSDQIGRAIVHRWPVFFFSNPPENKQKSVRASKWIKSKGEDEAEEGITKSNHLHTGQLKIETGY